MREKRNPEDLLRWSRLRRSFVGKKAMISMGNSKCKVSIAEHIRGTLFLAKTYENPVRELFVRQSKMSNKQGLLKKTDWTFQSWREVTSS